MTRKELERHREAIEAQIRWATLHDADHELLILLHIERSRFRVKIGRCPDLPIGHADRPQASTTDISPGQGAAPSRSGRRRGAHARQRERAFAMARSELLERPV